MALFLRRFGNHGLGRNQQTADRSGILQSRADNLGRVDDAGLDHIGIFAGLSIITIVGIGAFQQFAGNNRTVNARILDNLTDRSLRCLADNFDTDFLILISRNQSVQRFAGIQQSDAAAGDNAFLDRGTGRMQRVVNTVFLLLNFNFGSTADFDNGNAARKVWPVFPEVFRDHSPKSFLQFPCGFAPHGQRLNPSRRHRQ